MYQEYISPLMNFLKHLTQMKILKKEEEGKTTKITKIVSLSGKKKIAKMLRLDQGRNKYIVEKSCSIMMWYIKI